MSHLLAFPILYINLGGEMIYILEQRLQAQGVESEKSSRGGSPTAIALISNSYIPISLDSSERHIVNDA